MLDMQFRVGSCSKLLGLEVGCCMWALYGVAVVVCYAVDRHVVKILEEMFDDNKVLVGGACCLSGE